MGMFRRKIQRWYSGQLTFFKQRDDCYPVMVVAQHGANERTADGASGDKNTDCG
jgi:hypothetical protein